jgi:hypothetical protein
LVSASVRHRRHAWFAYFRPGLLLNTPGSTATGTRSETITSGTPGIGLDLPMRERVGLRRATMVSDFTKVTGKVIVAVLNMITAGTMTVIAMIAMIATTTVTS